MTIDYVMACGNLTDAIEEARNKRNEIYSLKNALPEDAALKELESKLQAKKKIKEHLVSAVNVTGDDNDEVKQQIEDQIKSLSDTIITLQSDIVTARNDLRAMRSALVERERVLRNEYATAMHKVSRAYEEYNEAAKSFEQNAIASINQLNTPVSYVFPENSPVRQIAEIPTATIPMATIPASVINANQEPVTPMHYDIPRFPCASEDVRIYERGVSRVTAENNNAPIAQTRQPVETYDVAPFRNPIHGEATQISLSEFEEDNIPDALPGLLSIMRKFEMVACEYGGRMPGTDQEYPASYKALWSEVKPSDVERRAVIDIVQKSHIKGLSDNQVRQLMYSLPFELLKACDTPSKALTAFAKDRAESSKIYFDGALNDWRPGFTYNIIKQLCDLAESKAYLAAFFADNTDCMVKSKKFPFLDKPVMKAFARLG